MPASPSLLACPEAVDEGRIMQLSAVMRIDNDQVDDVDVCGYDHASASNCI